MTAARTKKTKTTVRAAPALSGWVQRRPAPPER
jgi:hypothetical protein